MIEIITLIVDSVFEKAAIQPNYCPFYVKLILSIINSNNRTLIMTLLRNKCTIYQQILTKKLDGNVEVNNITNDSFEPETPKSKAMIIPLLFSYHAQN